MENIFIDIAILTVVATIGGYLAKIFKQPLIPIYILAGLLIGPIFGLITNQEVIWTMSQIGIAFLLFIVGLEINIKKLKETLRVSTIGGSIQTAVVGILGYFIALKIGFNSLESVYIALALTFSSTMIVLKILSDKQEIDTLHGRIVIGLLLLQDLVAILAITVLTSINNFSVSVLAASVAQGVLALA
ncbi:unnamed protein product, partial [marine sediment metagenome]